MCGDACVVSRGLELLLLNHKLGYYCLHCALGAWNPTSLQPRTAWSSWPRWPCRWPRTWTSSTWGHPILEGVTIMVIWVKALSTYCCLQFLQVTTRTTQDDSQVNLSLSFTPCHFHMVNGSHAFGLNNYKFEISIEIWQLLCDWPSFHHWRCWRWCCSPRWSRKPHNCGCRSRSIPVRRLIKT